MLTAEWNAHLSLYKGVAREFHSLEYADSEPLTAKDLAKGKIPNLVPRLADFED